MVFDDSQISNLTNITKNIYNWAGYKAQISTHIPYKIIDDLFFFLASTLLLLFFLSGYKLVKSGKISQTNVVKWAVVFSLLMTVAIPSHSSDLYGYIARGAQQSLYSQNPYLETVNDIKSFKSNPLFFNFMWPSQPTTYGPVFVYFTKAIVFLSNNDFLLSLINFKLLNLTVFFLIVLSMLKTCNIEEIYLISWNPFILIQGLWNCHNDLLTGALIFIGLLLLNKWKISQNTFWGIFFLTITIGIKYVSILILPIIFFYFLKQKSKPIIFLNYILGFSCGMLLIMTFSVDYLISYRESAISNFWKIISNVDLVHKSLIATLFTLLKYFCRYVHLNCDFYFIENILKYIVYLIFCLYYLSVLAKRKINLIPDIAWVIFFFFAFTIAKFHSWYLLNAILFIPLLKNSLIKKLLITLSLTHVYALTFLDQAKILNFVSMTLIPTICVFLITRSKRGNK